MYNSFYYVRVKAHMFYVRVLVRVLTKKYQTHNHYNVKFNKNDWRLLYKSKHLDIFQFNELLFTGLHIRDLYIIWVFVNFHINRIITIKKIKNKTNHSTSRNSHPSV